MRYCIVLLLAISAILPFCAQAQLAPAAPYPSLQGIVTFSQPNGQFYTTISSYDQIKAGAEVNVLRNGQLLARAKLVKVDRMNSIATLRQEYLGLRVQTGDRVVVTATPNPLRPTKKLPEIEPSLSQHEGDFFGIALFAFILGSLIVDATDTD